MRLREKLYLFALGPLSLYREDLWEITNGELSDMIVAHEYRKFLQNQEQAIHTTAIINMFAKRPVSVQDLIGVWYENRVWSKDDLFAYLHSKGGENE